MATGATIRALSSHPLIRVMDAARPHSLAWRSYNGLAFGSGAVALYGLARAPVLVGHLCDYTLANALEFLKTCLALPDSAAVRSSAVARDNAATAAHLHAWLNFGGFGLCAVEHDAVGTLTTLLALLALAGILLLQLPGNAADCLYAAPPSTTAPTSRASTVPDVTEPAPAAAAAATTAPTSIVSDVAEVGAEPADRPPLVYVALSCVGLLFRTAFWASVTLWLLVTLTRHGAAAPPWPWYACIVATTAQAVVAWTAPDHAGA